MTGEQFARELIMTLCMQYSISSTSLLAAMHDLASVNDVAICTIKVVYPALIDVGCFSHTLDLVGGKFNVPHLNDFITSWVSLFSHSPKERTDRSIHLKLFTNTWWTDGSLQNSYWSEKETLMTSSENMMICHRPLVKKLLEHLDDPGKKTYLELELAVIVDAGMPFVQVTYVYAGR